MSVDDVVFSREGLVRALRYLNSIVPSLDRIGSACEDLGREEYCRVLADYVEKWGILGGLAETRRILSQPFSDDEMESLFEDVPVWSLGSREPPKSR